MRGRKFNRIIKSPSEESRYSLRTRSPISSSKGNSPISSKSSLNNNRGKKYQRGGEQYIYESEVNNLLESDSVIESIEYISDEDKKEDEERESENYMSISPREELSVIGEEDIDIDIEWTPIAGEAVSLPIYTGNILQCLFILNKTHRHLISRSMTFDLLMRAMGKGPQSNKAFAFVIKSIMEILIMYSSKDELPYMITNMLKKDLKETWLDLIGVWTYWETETTNSIKLLTEDDAYKIREVLSEITPCTFHQINVCMKVKILEFFSSKLLYLPIFAQIIEELQTDKTLQSMINMLETDFDDLDRLQSEILYFTQAISWEMKGTKQQYIYTEGAPKMLFINMNEGKEEWKTYDLSQARISDIVELKDEKYPIPDKIDLFFNNMNGGLMTIRASPNLTNSPQLSVRQLKTILARMEHFYHNFWARNNYLWKNDNNLYLIWLEEIKNYNSESSSEFSKLLMEFVEGMFQPYQVLIRRESPETTYPLSFAPAIITRTRTPEEKVETMQKIAEQHVKLYHKNVKKYILRDGYEQFDEYFMELCKSENIYSMYTALKILEQLLKRNKVRYEMRSTNRAKLTIYHLYSKMESLHEQKAKMKEGLLNKEGEKTLRDRSRLQALKNVDLNRKSTSRIITRSTSRSRSSSPEMEYGVNKLRKKRLVRNNNNN